MGREDKSTKHRAHGPARVSAMDQTPCCAYSSSRGVRTQSGNQAVTSSSANWLGRGLEVETNLNWIGETERIVRLSLPANSDATGEPSIVSAELEPGKTVTALENPRRWK